MVVGGQAFTESTNGRENTTDGLWTHRGTLSVRDTTQGGNLLQVGGGLNYAQLNQQLIINRPAARLSAVGAQAWSDAPLRIDQQTPSEVRIGFHEFGSSALAIYKPQGSNHNLRVIGNDGIDYALGGSLLAAWSSPIDWTAPGGWTETPIQITCNVKNNLVRFDWRFTITHTGYTDIYWCVMRNGDPSFSGYQLGYAGVLASSSVPISGSWLHTAPGIGSYRFAIGIYGVGRIRPEAPATFSLLELGPYP